MIKEMTGIYMISESSSACVIGLLETGIQYYRTLASKQGTL